MRLYKLHQRRFSLHIRKKFSTESVIKHWNRPPREVVESPCVKVVKEHVDVALMHMVYLWTWQY